MMKKKYKIATLGLVTAMLLSITGCSQGTMTPSQPSGRTINSEGKVQLVDTTDTSIDTEQAYLDELNTITSHGNAIYSPTSSRASLQMYAGVTQNEDAKKSILKSLGDKDYLKFKNNDGQRFVNRIWLNESAVNNVEIPSDLAEYVYELDMSDSARATKMKNDYVAQQTNNFILNTPTIFTSDTIYDLMNVTYFKDDWAVEEGYRLNSEKLEFKNDGKDDNITEVDNFIAHSYDVYENNTCYAVVLEYKNGNYFWLVYPKTNVSEVSLKHLKQIDNTEAICYIPEFEFSCDYDLTNLILNTTEVGVQMTQVARIKVNRYGTEAAAVTEITKDAMAAPPDDQPEIIELKFDKPFLYYIQDTTNNDIIFIGRLSDMSE